MKAFLCHSSHDASFVKEVARYLIHNLEDVFYFEERTRSDRSFVSQLGDALDESEIMVVFVGAHTSESKYQADEFSAAFKLHQRRPRHFFFVLLPGITEIPAAYRIADTYPQISVTETTNAEALRVASTIVVTLGQTWIGEDGLPLDPYLFDYEKDVINHFIKKPCLPDMIREARERLAELAPESREYSEKELEVKRYEAEYQEICAKELKGCPPTWPTVTRWLHGVNVRTNRLDERSIGKCRPDDAQVLAAALSSYLDGFCRIGRDLTFPEAGPRELLAYPEPGKDLNVAIVVSGGIAPGINAVIDGITQRHHMYASQHNYQVHVYGIRNGFQAFDALNASCCMLITGAERANHGFMIPLAGNVLETSSHANEGGSILGTSRFEELIDTEMGSDRLHSIVTQLLDFPIDILYVIGGDGTMRAAHAIWTLANQLGVRRPTHRKLSVVAIPKTMDNDILWVWQTFGFLSAVERARDLIENLATEVKSNPRLGVVQLFGSDSGFVVSHAVLASRTGVCDAALIPEVDFRLKDLAIYLKSRMSQRFREQGGKIPYGLVVLAETAIPVDAEDYLDEEEIGLSPDEKLAVRKFLMKRATRERIRGQTADELRHAGLKIVSKGLAMLLRDKRLAVSYEVEPDWGKLRILTNEPRHLLRATPPTTSDIITAQRLGMLAVDNAIAGYTDFMVSQWLTEYVLVPLQLVVLGRKRIPREGIFWKSVLAKTGQPFDLAQELTH